MFALGAGAPDQLSPNRQPSQQQSTVYGALRRAFQQSLTCTGLSPRGVSSLSESKRLIFGREPSSLTRPLTRRARRAGRYAPPTRSGVPLAGPGQRAGRGTTRAQTSRRRHCLVLDVDEHDAGVDLAGGDGRRSVAVPVVGGLGVDAVCPGPAGELHHPPSSLLRTYVRYLFFLST